MRKFYFLLIIMILCISLIGCGPLINVSKENENKLNSINTNNEESKKDSEETTSDHHKNTVNEENNETTEEINKENILSKIFDTNNHTVGNTWYYNGPLEDGYTLILKDVVKDSNGNVKEVVFNCFLTDGLGPVRNNGAFIVGEISYILEDNKIIEKVNMNYGWNGIQGLVKNKILIQAPFEVGNSWSETVEYNGKDYTAKSTIVDVKNENSTKTFVVNTIINDIDGFENRTYEEVRNIELGKGMVKFTYPKLIDNGNEQFIYTKGYSLYTIKDKLNDYLIPYEKFKNDGFVYVGEHFNDNDIDDDGEPERIFLCSSMFVNENGDLSGDDRNKWGLFVEDNGKITELFNDYLQIAIMNAWTFKDYSSNGEFKIITLTKGSAQYDLDEYLYNKDIKTFNKKKVYQGKSVNLITSIGDSPNTYKALPLSKEREEYIKNKYNYMYAALLKIKKIDIDNDGIEESIELYANSETDDDGVIAWDDGQKQLILVKDDDDEQVLFNDYIQLGILDFDVYVDMDSNDYTHHIMVTKSSYSVSLREYIYNKNNKNFDEKIIY